MSSEFTPDAIEDSEPVDGAAVVESGSAGSAESKPAAGSSSKRSRKERKEQKQATADKKPVQAVPAVPSVVLPTGKQDFEVKTITITIPIAMVTKIEDGYVPRTVSATRVSREAGNAMKRAFMAMHKEHHMVGRKHIDKQSHAVQKIFEMIAEAVGKLDGK